MFGEVLTLTKGYLVFEVAEIDAFDHVELVGGVEGGEGWFGIAEPRGEAKCVDGGLEGMRGVRWGGGRGEGSDWGFVLLDCEVVLPCFGHDDLLPCFFLVLLLDVLNGAALLLDPFLHLMMNQ